MKELLRTMKALIKRDLLLSARIGGGGLLSVIFFILVVSMVPFGVGPEGALLSKIAAGMIWVGVVLAMLLSLDRLFQADFEDGTLDLLILSPLPAGALVLAKCTAHWLTTGLPLIIAAPILAILLQLPEGMLGPMLTGLLLGTPAMSLIGAIGASLTVGLRRGGLLLSLIVLPLQVPILIFGVGAAEGGGLWTPSHMFLAAISLIALIVGTWASALALKLNMT
jgi:heme exporter protein B